MLRPFAPLENESFERAFQEDIFGIGIHGFGIFSQPNYILEYTKSNYLKYTVINLLLLGRFVFNPALVNLLLTIVATS